MEDFNGSCSTEQFDSQGLNSVITRCRTDFMDVVNECVQLETEVKEKLKTNGIDFSEFEKLVKAKDGIISLLKIADKISDRANQYSNITKSIVYSFLDTFVDHNMKDVNDLKTKKSKATRTLDDLIKQAGNFNKNLLELKKAIKFIGLNNKEYHEFLQAKMTLGGVPNLDDLDEQMGENKGDIESLSREIVSLNNELSSLHKTFEKAKGA